MRLAHTAALDGPTLRAVRALLDEVFAGGFSDHDWDHALGGVHALLHEDGSLVGHGAVVQRRLIHGGRALRAGYVESLAVRADHRGRGHGATILRALHGVLAAYDLGALSSSDDGLRFYPRHGWQAWRGPLLALTPGGVVPTPDDVGGVFVLGCEAPLDLDGALVCDWRDGDLW